MHSTELFKDKIRINAMKSTTRKSIKSMRALGFGFGSATNWCLTLGKTFDIPELLFLCLETNEDDL